MLCRTILLLALVCFSSIPSRAQEKPPAPPQQPVAIANAADVASPEAIVAALYDVISGAAGQPRNWARFRWLFASGARLMPVAPRPYGGAGIRVLSPEEYVARTTPIFEKDGFFEKEIARRTERFGSIVHVFSTYEARHAADDPKPFLRGINSFQLYFDGTRWWVLTVLWQAESPETPLPPEYLPK